MRTTASTPVKVLILIVYGLLSSPVFALVSLNDGTDKIYVSGTFTMGFSSNITASAQNVSDTTYGASGSIEYQRRAGLIGVNANVGFALTDYFKNRTYNSLNPTFSAELDKTTGRTTGALTFTANKSSQADATANERTEAWNLSTGLNLHYPVIERYSFGADFGYSLIDYTQTHGQPLVNLDTFSADAGLFYVLNDEHDLSVSYRYRDEGTSASTSTTDDALMVGVSGRLFWEINGSVSIGYQIRTPHGHSIDGLPSESTQAVTAAGNASWAMNRRTTFNGSLSKDFSTTSLGATVDTTAALLNVKYAHNAKLAPSAGVGAGESQFLGALGLIPGTNRDRKDYYYTWNAGIGYAFFGQRLGSSLSYAFFHNWSNLGLASFTSNTISLTLSTRW